MSANADPRQLLLLCIAFMVPLLLILARKERALLAWVCFTVGIQILDTSIVTNLPAARLVGLLLLPQALSMLSLVRRTAPGRAMLLQYGYLVVLGVVFGFVVPWPSGDVARAFNQGAPGRAVIYLVRTAADISLTLFVARQIFRRQQPQLVLRMVLVGSTIAALAGLLEFVTRFDWYGNITGLVPMNYPYRMRGFNFEPRGLGLIAVQGMLICLVLYSWRRTGRMLALAGLHAIALFLSGSTSAIAVFLFAAFALFITDPRYRASMYKPFLVIAGAIGLLIVTQPQYLKTYVENALLRLTTDRIEEEGRPDTPIGNLSARMDILDGPPVLFFAANPGYILTGTGPGLMSLPAAAYIPPAAFYDEVRELGVNSPPTSGLLLEVANAGLVGFALWCVIYGTSLRAFGRLVRTKRPEWRDWASARSAYAAIGASYLVQGSVSPIWPIFMGLGLGAACIARRRPRRGKVARLAGSRVQSSSYEPSALQADGDR